MAEKNKVVPLGKSTEKRMMDKYFNEILALFAKSASECDKKGLNPDKVNTMVLFNLVIYRAELRKDVLLHDTFQALASIRDARKEMQI